MVGLLLRSYIRRFFGLFFSLVLVGGLSSGLFHASVSQRINLSEGSERFFQEYGYVNEQIDLLLDERDDYLGILDLEGVANMDMRVNLDAHVQKDDGRTINARILTYTDDETEIMHRYTVEEITPPEGKTCVSISQKYAASNNFKVGDTLRINVLSFPFEFAIGRIVDTVEEVFPLFNAYVWTDCIDFGYIYLSEKDANKLVAQYAPALNLSILLDKEAASTYERLLSATNLTPPNLSNIGSSYVSSITNQLIIQNKPGYSEDEVLARVEEYLSSKGITPTAALKGDDTPPRQYMSRVNNQFRIAFAFVPVFFYAIATILVGLFVAQIIRQSTRDIGIMLANGARRGEIVLVFLSFALIVAALSALIGIPIGMGLASAMTAAMIESYSIPIISASLSVPMVLIGMLVLIAVCLLASLLACVGIFKITPKDAAVNNETNRKTLSKPMQERLSKLPLTPQIAANSIMQNKRRFGISAFSICACLTFIFLSGFFFISKSEIIDQSCLRRIHYDCQLYLTEVVGEEYGVSLTEEKCVERVLDCYYTYAEVRNSDGEKEYLECLAYDIGPNADMIQIPDESGAGSFSLPEVGVVFPKSYAEKMRVRAGDTVTINNTSLTVTRISAQFYHPMLYMAKSQFEATGLECVSSLLIDTNDEAALSRLLNEKAPQSLFVFTSSLLDDLHSKFDPLDVFVYILIGFSVSIAFVILFMMAKNALLEQQYVFSLYRALGFSIHDISKIWLVERGLQLLLGLLVAIPLGSVAGYALFTSVSSLIQTFPFFFNFGVIGIGLAFVTVVVLVCHVALLARVKRLNLATNLRSGE